METKTQYEVKCYKIWYADSPEEIYVGSTKQPLSNRMAHHRADAKKGVSTTKIHNLMRQKGVNNFQYCLLGSCLVSNKDEQHMFEQSYIDRLKPVLNTLSAYVNCPHGRTHHKCVDCNGASICEHKRRREHCKDCGGASICEHGRIRNRCKDCGGASICEHGRIRSRCKDCNGSSICEHKRERCKCVQCGGSQICEHKRERPQCKDCGGSQICEHKRKRPQCKDCNGKKYYCFECDESFCSKNVLKRHEQSQKHKETYKSMFDECFGT